MQNEAVKIDLVTCQERKDFPIHPESYSPRIFFTTVQLKDNYTVKQVRHYELLTTGYALVWLTLPTDFDYMHFVIPNLDHMNMFHADEPRPTSYWAGTTVPTTESLEEIPSVKKSVWIRPGVVDHNQLPEYGR
jgi:hypothetical protein